MSGASVERGTTQDDAGVSGWGGRPAALVFALYVGIALPVIVFVLADDRWFFRDDWAFLAGRDVSVNGLFRPHLLQHLSAVPVLVFRLMWALFGATSYVPYQLLVAGVHLTVVVLIRVLLRHLGVGPWLATAGAAILVLFGPGRDNLIWAFQINYTGSILFGLTQLLLADHDGPLGRRDLLAVLAGLLAVLSSAVGVTMTVVVGAALLLRHGWRSAALQTVPPAAVVLVWTAVTHPLTASSSGPPDLAETLRWVGWSLSSAFQGLGHFTIVGSAMALLIVGGLALSVSTAGGGPPSTSRRARARQRIRPVAVPLAMLAGALLFAVFTARGRWTMGESAAKSSRYVYVVVVLLLPALCVAAEAVARRWPRARRALLPLLLLPIPFNVGVFEDPVFSAAYFAQHKATITDVVDLPLARRVPRDIYPPGWNATMSRDMTVGFLLDAREHGQLSGASEPLTPKREDELTIGLVVNQDPSRVAASRCVRVDSPLELRPAAGDVLHIGSPVRLSLAHSRTDPPTRVRYSPNEGSKLTFQISGVAVILSPPVKQDAFLLCGPDGSDPAHPGMMPLRWR